jgi:hypothetical protein
MRRKSARKPEPSKRHMTVRSTERLPELRVAALPPTPSLQAAIALMFYSITRASSGSKKPS